MPNESDKLVVLTKVPDDIEAALIVQALADRGIAATAVGGLTAAFRAEAPGGISILVRHGDLALAQIAWADARHEDPSQETVDDPDE